MINAEPSYATATYPEWKSTDWTPRQRTVALVSLCLFSGSCGLIAGALTLWGAGPLALDVFVPFGVNLFTLSAMLLSYVLWYAYHHAQNTAEYETKGIYALNGCGGFTVLALVFQVIADLLGAIPGWEGWRLYGLMPSGLPGALGGFILLLLAWMQIRYPFTPLRDPARATHRLTAPVTGARLLLRWAVMLLPRVSWALVWGVWRFGDLPGTDGSLQTPIAVFWGGAAFFLIIALIERLPTHSSPDTTL